jgi:hypothetical protein
MKFPFSLKVATAFMPSLFMAFVFNGCLTKEKHSKGDRINPPWENGQENLQKLEANSPAESDSTFQIFQQMATIDSEAGPKQKWTYEAGSPDTLRVFNLVDTGFIFPEKPLQTYAYAYDDTYRDDTLFRKAYGNGLYTEDHPCANVWIVSPPFIHPVRWLIAGMTSQDIETAMGPPSLRHPNAMRYFYRDMPTNTRKKSSTDDPEEQNIEGIHFYFKRDSLFAAVFQKSRSCH